LFSAEAVLFDRHEALAARFGVAQEELALAHRLLRDAAHRERALAERARRLERARVAADRAARWEARARQRVEARLFQARPAAPERALAIDPTVLLLALSPLLLVPLEASAATPSLLSAILESWTQGAPAFLAAQLAARLGLSALSALLGRFLGAWPGAACAVLCLPV